MNQEVCIESFKKMLGEAMLLGTTLSDRAYSGLLQDENNIAIGNGIENLHKSISTFLIATSLEGISVENILPLYEEIQQLSHEQEQK